MDETTAKWCLSIYSFNIQSLRAHSTYVIDTVFNNSKIVLFIETSPHGDENIIIPNFKCIVKYKRPNVRAAGLAIYHNEREKYDIVVPSVEMTLGQSKFTDRL